MNEPLEMVVERSAAESAHALRLARVGTTVATLVLLIVGLILFSSAAKFGVMFEELGKDAELPELSAVIARHSGGVLAALLALSAVTIFFIWAKGKAAAWMAGLGLLMIAIIVPILVFALFLPLVKIISEMGSM